MPSVINITQGSKKTLRKVKSLMVLHGIKQLAIAKKCGVTQAAVAWVVMGRNKSKRIRAAIAEAVGKRVEELWPEERNS